MNNSERVWKVVAALAIGALILVEGLRLTDTPAPAARDETAGRPEEVMPDAGQERFRDELMAADRAFDSATAERGVDGWVDFFASDGSQILPGRGEIRGHEAIRDYMGPALSREGTSLRWQPLRAEASQDGTLGFTTGEWLSQAATPDGGVAEARGRYVSIWRREADGSWKVVMDLGNPVE